MGFSPLASPTSSKRPEAEGPVPPARLASSSLGPAWNRARRAESWGGGQSGSQERRLRARLSLPSVLVETFLCFREKSPIVQARRVKSQAKQAVWEAVGTGEGGRSWGRLLSSVPLSHTLETRWANTQKACQGQRPPRDLVLPPEGPISWDGASKRPDLTSPCCPSLASPSHSFSRAKSQHEAVLATLSSPGKNGNRPFSEYRITLC